VTVSETIYTSAKAQYRPRRNSEVAGPSPNQRKFQEPPKELDPKILQRKLHNVFYDVEPPAELVYEAPREFLHGVFGNLENN
jgi:hypothetical protein